MGMCNGNASIMPQVSGQPITHTEEILPLQNQEMNSSSYSAPPKF